MSKKVSLVTLILLLMSGCVAQSASTPTSTVSVTPTATATLTEKQAIALANKFADLFVTQNDYAQAFALFDDQMKAALPESKLKETWLALPQQVGALQSRAEAQLGLRKDPYQRVIIPLQFEKTALNMLVVVDLTTGKISGLFFQPNQEAQAQQYKAPAYVDPAKFEEKEVTIGTPPWALPGTLTLPKGTGPFPAIVLVHGSGPNDRDETIGPNKPFKDIAQGLASQGIAVLRYDKRTKVYPEESAQLKDFSVKDETITDAVAAIEFLRSRPEINSQKVFVLGHSLGGYLAPRIAQTDSEIAGMVILAGATRPLEDLIVEQTRYILGSDGSLSAEDQTQLDQIQQQADAVKALTPQSPHAQAILGAPASYWLDLKDYHPAELARNLTLPLLILQGERDYQVTLQDFKNWQEALSGKANVTLKTYPSLNHLFISGKDKSTPSEYQTPGNVAPEVIQDVANWIEQHS